MNTQVKTEIATRDEYQAPAHDVRPASHEASLLAVIERVALNPDVDISRMEALLKMRADEEERQRRIAREDGADEARRAYLSAMSQVQAEIGPIFRSRKNEHTRSQYADLADIERIVTPILTKHGFSTSAEPVPCSLDRHIRMRLTIGHGGGHERHYEDDFPLDAAGAQGKTNKTDIQAKGSTQTYARRYLKASALDLSFMDDRDGNAPPVDTAPVSDEQLRDLRKALTVAKASADKFCEYFKIEALDDLPASQFKRALDVIEATRQKREAAEKEAAEAGVGK